MFKRIKRPATVEDIAASVAKPVAMVSAEEKLREIAAAEESISVRLGAINSRLHFRHTFDTLFEPEQIALSSEQTVLQAQLSDLRLQSGHLRKLIESERPAHATALAIALAPARRAAAINLTAALENARAAVAELQASRRILLNSGLSVIAVSEIPFAAAFPKIADRIIAESALYNEDAQ